MRGSFDCYLYLVLCPRNFSESCQGGAGHAFYEPTVRFHGDRSEGFRALAVAMQAGLSVDNLRRVWPIVEGDPTGPCWELTFRR